MLRELSYANKVCFRRTPGEFCHKPWSWCSCRNSSATPDWACRNSCSVYSCVRPSGAPLHPGLSVWIPPTYHPTWYNQRCQNLRAFPTRIARVEFGLFLKQQGYHHNASQAARRPHILCSICIHSFGACGKAVGLFRAYIQSLLSNSNVIHLHFRRSSIVWLQFERESEGLEGRGVGINPFDSSHIWSISCRFKVI